MNELKHGRTITDTDGYKGLLAIAEHLREAVEDAIDKAHADGERDGGKMGGDGRCVPPARKMD